MSYSATVKDEHGNDTDITIEDADSNEAVSNDYRVLTKTYNPKYVTIEQLQAQPGEEMHLSITVHAPSHYLDSEEDINPKPCEYMSVEIVAYMGYPLKALSAKYPSNHYLASPNVFRSGRACIDTWVPFSSSLLTVAEKLIMDMIHNPLVTRYDSMANHTMCDWHKEGVAKGQFPTMNPKLLFASSTVSLPARKSQPVRPKLPARKH